MLNRPSLDCTVIVFEEMLFFNSLYHHHSFDVNKDGDVSMEEYTIGKTALAAHDTIDTNKDGKISREVKL